MQVSVESGSVEPDQGQPLWLAVLRGGGGACMFVVGLAAVFAGGELWPFGVLLAVAGAWAMVSGIGS